MPINKFTSKIAKALVKIYLLFTSKYILRNVYGTSFKKKVLLSYIKQPFVMKMFGVSSTKHTNYLEAHTIAKIFDELGYIVDVVDYNSQFKVNYEEYDVVFGFGDPIQASFSVRKKLVRLFYGTGMNVNIQNRNTLNRMFQFYTKHNVWLPESVRYVSKQWAFQYSFCDSILALGNATCVDSYLKYSFKSDVYEIPSFYYEKHNASLIIDERAKENNRDYLWFGSSGAIHKGLDLVLDYFIANNTEHTLHICGLVENENDFWDFYKDVIINRDNIKYHGFVNIESREFKDILYSCAFVIYPSCSEGGSPSILNCVGNGGLLPIITREATIDIPEAIIIGEYNDVSIASAILESSSLSNKDLVNRQKNALSLVKNYYNYGNYESTMRNAITKTIAKGLVC